MPKSLIAESKPFVVIVERFQCAHDGPSHSARQGSQTAYPRPSSAYQVVIEQPGNALSEKALLAWEAFMTE